MTQHDPFFPPTDPPALPVMGRGPFFWTPKLSVPNPQGTLHLVSFRSLICAEAAGSYTRLVLTSEQELVVCRTLGHLETAMVRFGLPVVRTHRSHLISLNHVLAVARYSKCSSQVQLTGTRWVPLSKHRKRAFDTALQHFHLAL